jgi:HEAT repeat protein
LPRHQREAIAAGLEQVRARAFADGTPDAYFGALANSGRPDLIEPALLEYAEHPDPTVRRGAYEMLGRVSDDSGANAEALTHALAHDESSLVRGAAADTLAEIEPTPASADVLLQAALTDADNDVASHAVSALGTQLLRGSMDARAALETIRTNGSAALREQAAGILVEAETSGT